MENRLQVWSSGGGTQSAAIAAMIVRGDIAPPDLAVIVDTEREVSSTWKYHNEIIVPELKKVGVTLHRIAKSDFATVDLYSKKGDILIPAFTSTNGVGKLPTYCSNEWKERVVHRWVKTQTDAKLFNIWIGISTDELRRAKQTIGKWEKRYVLVGARKNRGDCISLVESMGWPKPPRSRCWQCPNQGTEEWQDLHDNHPIDFANAVKFEKQMQEHDEDLWLTQSCKPLSELVSEAGMFTGRCDSGFCFT